MSSMIPDLVPVEVEEFLGWLAAERGRSINTLSAYRRDLTTYCEWLMARGTDVHRVTPSDIDRFVNDRRESGAAASSVARLMAAVRTFHRFMVAEDRRSDDPSADFEGVKVPAGIPKPLSEDEVESLIAAVSGDDAVALRDRALLELLYATGARISEVCALSLGDIDLESGMVRLYGKGSKERLVPVGSHAREAVHRWLTEGRDDLSPVRWAR
ncbi:MAG: site-specific tyrosine recombinase XerD, partial [Acidimicrobiia bacterium]|nr:site-specific tyrosine recombinase XerD [Acidimicrobiia bacterium]